MKQKISKNPIPLRDARLSTPMTIKLAKIDYLTLKKIAHDNGMTLSCAARMATTHGIPKVRAVLSQLARRAANATHVSAN